ncbi:adenosylcobinamide-phosphate synthase CbiB [Methylocapsa palsarum]|uniref:Cobalamin biosynthesis protein CobD n=1 Tax=Methylocapsa palsarum TaxID=1612308 RepID=A0A1I4BZL7_9HYPH|nr:adenosylcobinamide-phosphate synthase CbiB [Methylocapsa palsarum]SFK73416.1 adenosylcobinamide-phosphate synthase [Methylocapsa palsarum]
MDFFASVPLAALALAIEACAGYPRWLFRAIGHPVTWIGALIACLDARLNRENWPFTRRRVAGFAALAAILAAAGGCAHGLGLLLAALPRPLGFIASALIASSLIAQRSLSSHVLAVADALDDEGVGAGRRAVAAIVGRDVADLDEAGIARAAIESLAENFSDGIVAPLFWLTLGGLAGGACYKAVNTADSMIGHRTARHDAFGYSSAKLDDLLNLVPARLSVLWVGTAACVIPGASATSVFRIAWRDAAGRASPNAGWPEAAFAGALRLRLGGPRSYGAVKIEDGWIGEGKERAGSADIRRALRLYWWACAAQGCALAAGTVLALR